MACNLNVTPRVGDSLLYFEIFRNKNASPENFLKVILRGFDMKPTLYELYILFLRSLQLACPTNKKAPTWINCRWEL